MLIGILFELSDRYTHANHFACEVRYVIPIAEHIHTVSSRELARC
jgi:hypothetical protein